MMGFLTIASISAASDKFFGSMPAAAASFFRTSALAGIFSLPEKPFELIGVIGRFQIFHDFGLDTLFAQ